MTKGIINKSLLEKNIEYLEFYTDDEKAMLNKIFNKVNDIINNYNSENTKLLVSRNFNLKKNIDDIIAKRIKYSKILNNVIVNYNTLANNVVKNLMENNYE